MSPEVGPESGGFWPAKGHILPICRRNWRRMRYLALKAGCELVVDAGGGIRNEGLADCAGVSVAVFNKDTGEESMTGLEGLASLPAGQENAFVRDDLAHVTLDATSGD